MAGTMSQADVRADLKASLHDAANALTDPDDFDRCLLAAVSDLGRYAPRTLVSNITLSAGVQEYAGPDDMISFKMALWGTASPAKPWDKTYPGRLPSVQLIGSTMILVPAPSANQIGLLGSNYRFFYFAGYALAENAVDTTVPVCLRDLLILRAQAECCKELALRNFTKPVAIGAGGSGTTKNGTPSALFKMLMDEFMLRIPT